MRKKIVFCGPPGAGKTTLKRIFFEKANPLRLLESSLEPTVGYTTTVYRDLHSSIGIFDLGGQENDRWLSTDAELFSEANAVLCVIPVTCSLNDSVRFLLRASRVFVHQCPAATLYILYHKIDLKTKCEILRQFRDLQRVIDQKFKVIHPQIHLHQSSIAQKYFYATFGVFSAILTDLLAYSIVILSKKSYYITELALRMLLKLEYRVRYFGEAIRDRYDISSEIMKEVTRLLERHQFVEITRESQGMFIELTDRAYFFQTGIKKSLLCAQPAPRLENHAHRLFKIFRDLSQAEPDH